MVSQFCEVTSFCLYFCRCVFVGEENTQNGGSAQEILHFEGVNVRVVRWFVIVRHKIDNVRLCPDENDFEEGIVKAGRLKSGPK